MLLLWAAADDAPISLQERIVNPILWREPGALSGRDLFWASGAAERAPREPFDFQEEDTSGTQPKVVVKDVQGVMWDVKLGVEARAEIAANRIIWALGYLVEETYFVAEGTIHGARGLKRADNHITTDGRFRAARFKRRDPRLTEIRERWAFDQNPFLGQRDLSGLVILMTLINNWDIEGARNNAILRTTRADGSIEHWYIVADLGATFGKMGPRLSSHTKWHLEDFLAEDFIKRTARDHIELDYDGLEPTLGVVPIEHARWFGGLAAQLSEAQLRRAFEAAGATAAEIDGFSTKVAAKIRELQSAVTAADR
ncbi:MAG: hypothetical protein ACRD1S_04045 [Vicinamibacterales bacterium]